MKTGVRLSLHCTIEWTRLWTGIGGRVGSGIVQAQGCRSEIIRLNLIWIIPAKGLMRLFFSFSGSCMSAACDMY